MPDSTPHLKNVKGGKGWDGKGAPKGGGGKGYVGKGKDYGSKGGGKGKGKESGGKGVYGLDLMGSES